MRTRTMSATASVLTAFAVALAGASASEAHVTVQPKSVTAGGFARLDVRVPNERDNAATEKVEVKFPDGFLTVSYEPVEGWSVDVKREKADPGADSGHGGGGQVSTVTFTADSPEAAIQPGQFRDFGISVGLPEDAKAGETLTFPAIQTYDNGEVVRWIGDADSENPAAEVALTAADEGPTAHGDEDADDGDDDDGGAPTALVVVALALAAVALALGLLNRRKA